MEEKLRQLKMLLNEASDLEHVVELMEWDSETYMPPGGAEDRAHHRATVESLDAPQVCRRGNGQATRRAEAVGRAARPGFGRCRAW